MGYHRENEDRLNQPNFGLITQLEVTGITRCGYDQKILECIPHGIRLDNNMIRFGIINMVEIGYMELNIKGIYLEINKLHFVEMGIMT